MAPRHEGVVCDRYSQRINCRAEETQTSVDFSDLRGALMWALPLGDQVRLGAGGGLSFNTCSGSNPPQYDPYCGMEPFREIELGLSYFF